MIVAKCCQGQEMGMEPRDSASHENVECRHIETEKVAHYFMFRACMCAASIHLYAQEHARVRLLSGRRTAEIEKERVRFLGQK